MTLNEAHLFLKEKLNAVYEPREASNIANMVIENISGLTRTNRLIDIGLTLNDEQTQKMNSFIERLIKNEPIQYVLEECWFANMKFWVNKHVLIPRPETEELVDWMVKEHLKENNYMKILDIGTGSGCIPISIQKKLTNAEVWTCDVSEQALEVAKLNAAKLDTKKIIFQQLDFLDPAQREALPNFDIIVSNPPYIPAKDKTEMHANVLDFEPELALFVPDNNPLVFYEAIAEFGISNLNEAGMIYVEIHESLGTAVVQLFQSKTYKAVELRKDLQGRDRMVKVINK